MIGMARYPDKFFDLAIVDPPYGNNLSGGRDIKNKWSKDIDWEKCASGWNLVPPTVDYFNELFRCSKNQIIWGGNYFSPMLPASECWLIWDKCQRNFSLADGELAWTSFDKATRIYSLHRSPKNNPNRIHPTQKPVVIYKWILKMFAKPGDKILDTHLGSQSSRIASYDLGFDFYGWELDQPYFESGNKRFNQFKSQPKIQFPSAA